MERIGYYAHTPDARVEPLPVDFTSSILTGGSRAVVIRFRQVFRITFLEVELKI